MTKHQKTIKTIISLLFLAAAGSITGYFIRILIARYLTVEEFGLFFTVFSFITVLNLGRSFGLDHSVVKHIPEYIHNNKKESVTISLTSILLFKFFASVIISSIVLIFINPLANNYFKSPVSKAIILIFLVYYITNSILQTITTGFHGMKKFNRVSFINVVKNVLLLGLIVLFSIVFELNIVTISLAYVASIVITTLIYGFNLIFTLKKELIPLTIKFRKDILRKHLIFGLPLIIVIISKVILTNVDILMLNYFTSLESVGIYSASVSVASILKVFEVAITMILVPTISELHAKKKKRKLKEQLRFLTNFSLVALLPIAIGIIIFSKEVMKTFFPIEYVSGFGILSIMAINVVIWTWASINLNACISLNHPKKYAKAMYIGLISNIILNLALIPLFGNIGAAIATMLSSVVILFYSINQLYKISNVKYSLQTILKLLGISGIFTLIVLLFNSLFGPKHFIWILVLCIISSLPYIYLIQRFKILNLFDVKKMLESKLK